MDIALELMGMQQLQKRDTKRAGVEAGAVVDVVCERRDCNICTVPSEGTRDRVGANIAHMLTLAWQMLA